MAAEPNSPFRAVIQLRDETPKPVVPLAEGGDLAAQGGEGVLSPTGSVTSAVGVEGMREGAKSPLGQTKAGKKPTTPRKKDATSGGKKGEGGGGGSRPGTPRKKDGASGKKDVSGKKQGSMSSKRDSDALRAAAAEAARKPPPPPLVTQLQELVKTSKWHENGRKVAIIDIPYVRPSPPPPPPPPPPEPQPTGPSSPADPTAQASQPPDAQPQAESQAQGKAGTEGTADDKVKKDASKDAKKGSDPKKMDAGDGDGNTPKARTPRGEKGGRKTPKARTPRGEKGEATKGKKGKDGAGKQAVGADAQTSQEGEGEPSPPPFDQEKATIEVIVSTMRDLMQRLVQQSSAYNEMMKPLRVVEVPEIQPLKDTDDAYYKKLLNAFPRAFVSVPLILHCMVEQVVHTHCSVSEHQDCDNLKASIAVEQYIATSFARLGSGVNDSTLTHQQPKQQATEGQSESKDPSHQQRRSLLPVRTLSMQLTRNEAAKILITRSAMSATEPVIGGGGGGDGLGVTLQGRLLTRLANKPNVDLSQTGHEHASINVKPHSETNSAKDQSPNNGGTEKYGPNKVEVPTAMSHDENTRELVAGREDGNVVLSSKVSPSTIPDAKEKGGSDRLGPRRQSLVAKGQGESKGHHPGALTGTGGQFGNSAKLGGTDKGLSSHLSPQTDRLSDETASEDGGGSLKSPSRKASLNDAAAFKDCLPLKDKNGASAPGKEGVFGGSNRYGTPNLHVVREGESHAVVALALEEWQGRGRDNDYDWQSSLREIAGIEKRMNNMLLIPGA
ncbi:hypothetical protein CBR_g17920 [Chara braunii]|uniref:Uncharacterized protein n=1 Tax=Chara braunii TaxID=69332 RepID=A0A388KVY4_CHABU|nr:hypothetical protein CBR_g17920 [Chara braunii]|eukprot:GBG74207.1 hypothetical protein CBR_g17920 [Chara braunii]